jgi:hypothetical protein
MRPGGIEYGDTQSEKSQELLKNIRIETSNKIEWLQQIKKELLKKEKPSVVETLEPKTIVEKNTENNKKYWISYTKNRDVVLNDKHIINTMQFERTSDCWFDYIFNNPNKPITSEEIENETKKSGAKDYDFNKFLDSIKFKGQLRKLFFKQGKRGIIFYNPITERDFKNNVSINHKKLEREIKKLGVI